jgi:hypothetical protein
VFTSDDADVCGLSPDIISRKSPRFSMESVAWRFLSGHYMFLCSALAIHGTQLAAGILNTLYTVVRVRHDDRKVASL